MNMSTRSLDIAIHTYSNKISTQWTNERKDTMPSQPQTNNSHKEEYIHVQLEKDDTLIKRGDLDSIVSERIRLKLQVQWHEEWCELLYDARNDDGNCQTLWKNICEHLNSDLDDERKRLERSKKRYEQILDRLQTRDMIFNQVRCLHDSLLDQGPMSGETTSLGVQETINYLCVVRNTTEEMKLHNRQLQNELEKTQQKLKKMTAEKEEVLTRLSELAGNRLTHNNSEIADLSDTNRPTNLAEKFNELYDNEWTDAFDHVTSTGRSQEDTVKELLKVLREVYMECSLCVTSQRTNLYNALQMSNKGQDQMSPRQSKQTIPDNFIHLNRQITELQKSTSEYCVTQMKNKLAASVQFFDLPFTTHHGRLSPFVNKCVELCWYMSIQEKPVVLVFETEKGRSFRTDLYRLYTKSGTKCDFLVWPAMLLHDKGPLLQKGVIQPE